MRMMILLAALLALVTSPASAGEFLPMNGMTAQIPFGAWDFCQANKADVHCEQQPDPASHYMPMNIKRLSQLKRVHEQVVGAVSYMTDEKLYGTIEKWAYPVRGFGDCEDYALAMMVKLQKLGWDRSMLDMVVVHTRSEVHADLVAHTTDGDFVLDSTMDGPKRIQEMPVVWIKTTIGGDFLVWHSLAPQLAAK